MPISFQIATRADAFALTQVQKRTFDDDSQRYLGKSVGGPPGYDDVLWQERIMGHGTYYKIMDGEQIIGGFIVFAIGDGGYNLGRIYLDPAYQNRGIGTQAMQFIETAYPHATHWTLDTPVWATRNQHFYEKLGYRRVRIEKEMIWYKKQVKDT